MSEEIVRTSRVQAGYAALRLGHLGDGWLSAVSMGCSGLKPKGVRMAWIIFLLYQSQEMLEGLAGGGREVLEEKLSEISKKKKNGHAKHISLKCAELSQT